MRDPDEEYLIADREGRDRDRYSIADMGPTSGLNFRDLTLKEEVAEALAFHEDVDDSHIEVDVRGAVVTLMGSVPTDQERTEATECASDIDGVITVINQLEVNS